MKYSPVSLDSDQGKIFSSGFNTAEYDRILEKSKEFLAALQGFGPFIGFGLSDIHQTLTIVIGEIHPPSLDKGHPNRGHFDSDWLKVT